MSIDYSHFKSEDATFLKNVSVMCKKTMCTKNYITSIILPII